MGTSLMHLYHTGQMHNLMQHQAIETKLWIKAPQPVEKTMQKLSITNNFHK
jgi:hypothetical protein